MRVIGLGALCDVAEPEPTDRRESTFVVSEFAVLADGRRITLHDERGFGGRLSQDEDVWRCLTAETLESDVRTTVLPDEDDTEDDHPWVWLVESLRAQGVESTVEELQRVPYEVVLSERVLARLKPRA